MGQILFFPIFRWSSKWNKIFKITQLVSDRDESEIQASSISESCVLSPLPHCLLLVSAWNPPGHIPADARDFRDVGSVHGPERSLGGGQGYPLQYSFFFLILFLLYFTLQYCIGFAIHWHESTMGVYKLPILNPPPISHPISSLWIIPMHQPQACCILYRT